MKWHLLNSRIGYRKLIQWQRTLRSKKHLLWIFVNTIMPTSWLTEHESSFMSCPHCPPVGPLIPASHKSSPGCRTTSGSYPPPSELQVPLTSAHSPPDPVRAHSRRSIDPTSPAKSPVPSPLQSHRRRRLLGRAPSPVEPDNPLSDSRQHRSRVYVSTRSQREDSLQR